MKKSSAYEDLVLLETQKSERAALVLQRKEADKHIRIEAKSIISRIIMLIMEHESLALKQPRNFYKLFPIRKRDAVFCFILL